MHRITAFATVALAVAPAAHAEVAARRWIDSADAAVMTDACVALATRSGWKVHVAVLNGHGDLIRFVGMNGATRTSGVLALEKARTVFRTGRSTRDVAKMDPNAQRLFDAVALTGGIPVLVDSRLVGTVGVSGASADDDEICAKAGVDAAM